MRILAFVIAVVLICSCSLLAQEQRCHSVTFSAELGGNHAFKHKLGNDIWFVAYPDKGSWRMRIGPGQQPQERFDIGWALEWAWNENWELGPTHGRNAEAAMKWSPRLLWFAVTKNDFERFKATLRRALSSNSNVAESGEIDPSKVLAEIPKGLAKVAIVQYRLSEAHDGEPQAVLSAHIEVTINAPSTFPLIGGVNCSCPTETGGLAQAFAEK